MSDPMNINVHIERLILDGITVPHSQRPRLQAAVETELTRLLTEDGLASGMVQGGAVPQVSADTIQLTEKNNPAHLGQQIARSVYGGIGK